MVRSRVHFLPVNPCERRTATVIYSCSFSYHLVLVFSFPVHGEEIVLTPVRRSIRKTPLKQDLCVRGPAIVTTPRQVNVRSPGLRLTPNTTADSEQNQREEKGTLALGVGLETQLFDKENVEEIQAEKPGVISVESNANFEAKVEDEPTAKPKARAINKSSARVSFQSDKPHTPCNWTSFPAVPTSDAQKSTPKASSNRRLSRKCRSRAPTPFCGKSERRISEDEMGEAQEGSTPRSTVSTMESDEIDWTSQQEGSDRGSPRKTPTTMRSRAPSVDGQVCWCLGRGFLAFSSGYKPRKSIN